jgi:uncharacterized protein DUF1059
MSQAPSLTNQRPESWAQNATNEVTNMARKWIDCRDFPDDTGCTLYLSGEEDQVVRAVAEHAASVHGEQDTPQLREYFRSILKDETTPARV